MQLNHDPTPVEFRSAAIALAKVGKIFDLPTITTSSYETGPNSPIIQELSDLHPTAPVSRAMTWMIGFKRNENSNLSCGVRVPAIKRIQESH